ncbi:MAG: hypothetical protein IIZ55_00605, partial [Firmicutes bacterium]|nr:hypothetical protein [Bacillota bacterium]
GDVDELLPGRRGAAGGRTAAFAALFAEQSLEAYIESRCLKGLLGFLCVKLKRTASSYCRDAAASLSDMVSERSEKTLNFAIKKTLSRPDKKLLYLFPQCMSTKSRRKLRKKRKRFRE